MTRDEIKSFVYHCLNITSLYIAAVVFEVALIVDFFKGGDENG